MFLIVFLSPLLPCDVVAFPGEKIRNPIACSSGLCRVAAVGEDGNGGVVVLEQSPEDHL